MRDGFPRHLNTFVEVFRTAEKLVQFRSWESTSDYHSRVDLLAVGLTSPLGLLPVGDRREVPIRFVGVDLGEEEWDGTGLSIPGRECCYWTPRSVVPRDETHRLSVLVARR